MVTDRKKDSAKAPVKQGPEDSAPEPNKINASTPYDFSGKNLTPYGGLLPVITMLEKLGFQALVEQTITSDRIPRAMDLYRFVLGIVLGLYIGFPRLNQLRFIARDPILTGILKVTKLPVQSTFWRFINGLHLNVARQMLTIMRAMRERVWAAANVKLEAVTLELQPEEQRQEELPADADVHRRDAGIYLGRTAQRRPAQWQTDRRSHTECVCGPAAGCEADLWPG
jgi:hypothetical protein